MIRHATDDDFEFVYELHMHPGINRFLFYDLMTADEFWVIFRELVNQGSLYIYHEGGPGIGMFKLMSQKHRASHVAILGGVAVHPSSAGKGCGSRMMAEILALGKERGFVRMQLGVSTINTKAVAFYEKAGFVREGILKKYIYLKEENRYLDDILMAYLY